MSALGIVDAGVGGLGVYRAIRARSDASIYYFSDSGFTPYGITDEKSLRVRLEMVFEFLHQHGVNKIAVACNAASCVFPNDDHLTGIIRFGVEKILASKHQNIGIIGGERTIQSNSYGKHLQHHPIKVRQEVAQALSRHVEAGRLTGALLHADIQRILSPLKNSDAILLACTHYPAITEQIRQHISRHTELIDPADLMADWLHKNWLGGISKGHNKWFTSGDTKEFIEHAQTAFAVDVHHPETVHLT